MRRKDEQIEETPEYDLDNPADLETIKLFEKVLEQFQSPWSLELWMIQQGIVAKARVVEIDLDGRRVKKVDGDYAVVYDRFTEYEEAKRKKRGIERLQAKRAYAKKMEHLDQLGALGITECPDSPGRVEADRVCRICYRI